MRGKASGANESMSGTNESLGLEIKDLNV